RAGYDCAIRANVSDGSNPEELAGSISRPSCPQERTSGQPSRIASRNFVHQPLRARWNRFVPIAAVTPIPHLHSIIRSQSLSILAANADGLVGHTQLQPDFAPARAWPSFSEGKGRLGNTIVVLEVDTEVARCVLLDLQAARNDHETTIGPSAI